ncbi:MAG: hypothetical protein WBY44_30220 [Bryobacteraceae bacterium]
MNKMLTIALGLGAGLLGGLLTRYIAPPAAHAQDQAAVAKEIRAQSFTLVDEFNHTAGTFTYEAPPAARMTIPLPPSINQPAPQRWGAGRIVLRDANGREIWSAGGHALIRPATER